MFLMKMEEYLLYNTEVLRLHSMPVHSSHDNDEVHLHQNFRDGTDTAVIKPPIRYPQAVPWW